MGPHSSKKEQITFNMKKEHNLIRVFTGDEISAIYLKGELEKIGIPSMIRNDFQSGAVAGFGGVPSAIDLYIQEKDLEEARPLIDEMTQKNG
jgi:hypothetical protein